MRTFHLHRLEDETGISGVGRVAEGVIFRDGNSSVSLYDNLTDVEAIHGHNSKTKVVVD